MRVRGRTLSEHKTILSAILLATALGLTSLFMPSDRAAAQSPAAPPATAQAPDAAKSAPEQPSPQPAAEGSAPARDSSEAPASTEAAHTASATLPHDLSPWGMFLSADIVVKGVMTGLAFASLATWTIGLYKSVQLFISKRRVKKGLAQIANAKTLKTANENLKYKRGHIALFIAAATYEAERSIHLPIEGTKERAAALLQRLEQRAGRSMTRGTGVLATIGSTAPFVGLFGTVWGIMNSFIGISKANTTNLAVVAPGIAEALLATAIGLVAAIPAVVIYNLFARSITTYRSLLADASTEVMRHLSRDLDRQNSGTDDGQRVVMMRRSAE